MMRRRFTLLVSIAALMGLMALPAAANDDPEHPPILGPFTSVFDATDPCTGTDHEVTIIWTVRVQSSGDTVIGTFEVSGTTDSGYVMVSGGGTFKDSDRGFKSVWTELWYNASTGAEYEYTEIFRDNGNVVNDETGSVCLTAP